MCVSLTQAHQGDRTMEHMTEEPQDERKTWVHNAVRRHTAQRAQDPAAAAAAAAAIAGSEGQQKGSCDWQ